MPGQADGQQQPQRQQHGVYPGRCTLRHHPQRKHQFQQGHPHCQAAVDGQRFQRLRLNDLAQQRSNALAAHQLQVQAQGTGHQTGFQQPARVHRKTGIEPSTQGLQWHQREHQQPPGVQPTGVEFAVQHAAAHQAPADDLGQVDQRKYQHHGGHALRQTGCRPLSAPSCAGGLAQHPAWLVTHRGQPLLQQGLAYAVILRGAQMQGLQQFVDLRRQRRFMRPAQGGAQQGQRYPVYLQVGPQQMGLTPAAVQQQPKATFEVGLVERAGQNGGAGMAQHVGDLGHAAVHRFDFNAQLVCGPIQPRGHVFALWSHGRGGQRAAWGARFQSRPSGQALQSFRPA